MASGERLPSSRCLAGQLQVARRLVTAAYARPTAEGYLVTCPGAGTCAGAIAPRPVASLALASGQLTRSERTTCGATSEHYCWPVGPCSAWSARYRQRRSSIATRSAHRSFAEHWHAISAELAVSAQILR